MIHKLALTILLGLALGLVACESPEDVVVVDHDEMIQELSQEVEAVRARSLEVLQETEDHLDEGAAKIPSGAEAPAETPPAE